MICCENISTDRRRHPHDHRRNVRDSVQSLENRGRPQKRTWVTARSRIHMQESLARPDDCQAQTTVRDRPKSVQCRLESAKTTDKFLASTVSKEQHHGTCTIPIICSSSSDTTLCTRYMFKNNTDVKLAIFP